MNVLISWNTVASLWIIFAVYWAINALWVKRAQRMETSSWRLATLAVLAVGATLIFSQSARFGTLSERFVPESEWIKGSAILLVAAGVGIAIWARRHLGEFWSAGNAEGRPPVNPVGTICPGAASDLFRIAGCDARDCTLCG